MFTALMPGPKQQFFNAIGLPLVGGKIYTYSAGTSSPKDTYTDEAGTIKQANPVILNVRGEPASPIRWNGSYRVEVRDALNNLVYSVDDFQTPVISDELASTDGPGLIGFDQSKVYSVGTLGRWLLDLALSGGSTLLGYLAAGAAAKATTVQLKLQESVSVFDFMTKAQKDDVRAGTMALDVTAAIQAAINYQRSVQLLNLETSEYTTISAPRLYFPFGRYKVTGLTIYESFDAYGDRAVLFGSSAITDIITGAVCRWYSIDGMVFVGGKSHLNVGNPNYDASRFVATRCEFHYSADYVCRQQGYGTYTHLSATFYFGDCKFMHPRKIGRHVADYTIYERCDMYPDKDNFDADSAVFLNDICDGNNRTYFIDCTGVPTMGTYGVDRILNPRWMDHKGGDVFFYRTRFGGEDAGIVPVYFSAPPKTANPYIGPQLLFDGCEMASGPQADPRSGVVFLNGQVPQMLGMRDCKGPFLVPYVNNSAGLVNFATYYSNWETATGLKAYNYFKVKIDNILSQAEDFSGPRVPIGMLKYTRARELMMRNNVAQAIPAAVPTSLNFNEVTFDNMGGWTVANPSRLYVSNLTNRALVGCAVSLASGIANGKVELRMVDSSGNVMAATESRFEYAAGSGLSNTELCLTFPVYAPVLSGAEFYEFKLYCTGAGGCTTLAGRVRAFVIQQDQVG